MAEFVLRCGAAMARGGGAPDGELPRPQQRRMSPEEASRASFNPHDVSPLDDDGPNEHSTGCCSMFVRRSFRDGEPEDERQRKKVLVVPFAILGIIACCIYVVESPLTDGYHWCDAYTGGLIICALSMGGTAAYTVITQKMPLQLVEAALGATAIGIVCIDWRISGVSGQGGAWTLLVVVVDSLLVVNASTKATKFVLVMATIWFVATAVEGAFRFGMYRIDGWSHPPEELMRKRTQCADLPCPSGWIGGVLGFTMRSIVFHFDFHVTRGFSSALRAEAALVTASICTSEELAVLLSEYEIDKAARLLTDDGDAQGLPPRLRYAFDTLVRNLRAYRPWLPASCLQHQAAEGDDGWTVFSHSTRSSERRRRSVGRGLDIAELEESGGPRSMSLRSADSDVDDMASMASSVSSGLGQTPGSSHLPPIPNDGTWVSRAESRPTALDKRPRRHRTKTVRASPSPSPRDLPRDSTYGGFGHRRLHRSGSTTHLTATRPERRNASIAVSNVRDTLSAAGRPSNVSNVKQLLERVLGFIVAQANKEGIVDAIAGDHAMLSWNGARRCPDHRKHAARTLSSVLKGFGSIRLDVVKNFDLDDVLLSFGSASGSVLCGAFGCEAARQFAMLGTATNWACLLERLAAQWDVAGAALCGPGLYASPGGDGGGAGDAPVFRAYPERVLHPKLGAEPLPLRLLLGADPPDTEFDDAVNYYLSGQMTAARQELALAGLVYAGDSAVGEPAHHADLRLRIAAAADAPGPPPPLSVDDVRGSAPGRSATASVVSPCPVAAADTRAAAAAALEADRARQDEAFRDRLQQRRDVKELRRTRTDESTDGDADDPPLLRVLRRLGLATWLGTLHEAGIQTEADLAGIASPDDLPEEMPMIARRKLAEHNTGAAGEMHTELRRALSSLGLAQHRLLLQRAGITSMQDLTLLTATDELPNEIPVVARRKLLQYAGSISAAGSSVCVSRDGTGPGQLVGPVLSQAAAPPARAPTGGRADQVASPPLPEPESWAMPAPPPAGLPSRRGKGAASPPPLAVPPPPQREAAESPGRVAGHSPRSQQCAVAARPLSPVLRKLGLAHLGALLTAGGFSAIGDVSDGDEDGFAATVRRLTASGVADDDAQRIAQECLLYYSARTRPIKAADRLRPAPLLSLRDGQEGASSSQGRP